MNFAELNEDALALYNEDAWGEHPRYPRSDWRYEVANEDTQVGYWEWLSTKLDQDGDDELSFEERYPDIP